MALVAKQFRTAKRLKLEYANFIFAFYIVLVAVMLFGFVGKAQLEGMNNGKDNVGSWIEPKDGTTSFRINCNSTTLGIIFKKNGNLGVGTLTPSVKFHVVGTALADAWNTSSDFRFKTNIQPLSSALTNVMLLKPVTYNYKVTDFQSRGFSKEKQIGFIAQDVQKLFPELVTTDNEGYLAMDYAKVTPILVKAVQEQQELINEIKEQNKLLQEQITLIKLQNIEMKASIENLQNSKTTTVSTNR